MSDDKLPQWAMGEAHRVIDLCFPKIKLDEQGRPKMSPLQVDFPILPEELARALVRAREEGRREPRTDFQIFAEKYPELMSKEMLEMAESEGYAKAIKMLPDDSKHPDCAIVLKSGLNALVFDAKSAGAREAYQAVLAWNKTNITKELHWDCSRAGFDPGANPEAVYVDSLRDFIRAELEKLR